MSGVRSVFAIAARLLARITGLPIKTIGEACRQQSRALIEALILQVHERLAQGQKTKDVFTQLFAKQQAMAVA